MHVGPVHQRPRRGRSTQSLGPQVSASRSLAIRLTIMLASLSSPVAACSVRHPVSPQDLVARADSIYYVRALGYADSYSPSDRNSVPQVRFSVISRLKGKPATELVAPGVLVQLDDPNESPFPFDFVRPAGRLGRCFATQYKPGAEYVMLYRGGTPYWSPLAPTNEQVTGASDRWLVWIRGKLSRR
jgi:hypothetical protein